MSRTDEDLIGFFDALEARIEGWWPDVRIGLTDAEIQKVSLDQGAPVLPAAYVEFLRRMGRSGGPFLLGTTAFYPDIIGLQVEGREFFAANGVNELLAASAVIFATHQGYQFYWFLADEGDDPAVMVYEECDPGVTKQWASFTDFLTQELNEEMALTSGRSTGLGVDEK